MNEKIEKLEKSHFKNNNNSVIIKVANTTNKKGVGEKIGSPVKIKVDEKNDDNS